MDGMLVSPGSYVETLIHQRDGIWRWAFGKNNKGRVLMNRVNVIIRNTRELASLSALCHVSIHSEDVYLPKRKRSSPDTGSVCTFTLDIQL